MCPPRAARSGFVNAHTHLYSGLAPLGMPAPAEAPANFLQILERVWWRLDRALDAPTLRAAARLYVAEALLCGTTVLVDHHESPAFIDGSLDVLADACQELGMRAVLCYGATERNGGRDEARRGLAENRRFLASNRRPLVRGAVGLHASFTVSDETIREAGELCRELGTVLHVHAAEDRADVDDARRRGYAGPLERLEALQALPAGSILAHGVHLSAAQVERTAALGCWIVQNPRSNANNRVGYPPALSHSDRIAVGTDGFAADMREEGRALARDAAANGEPARTAADRMRGGERLASGLWNTAHIDPAALLGTCETTGERIDRVTIAGRAVVDGGALQTADLAAIRGEARDAAAALWERMGRL